jgi:mono/diheme cytochrome c family protein
MRRAFIIPAVCLALVACDEMTDQPRQRGYAPAAAPARVPSGTVQYQDKPVAVPPVTLALIQRGQERFRIYCTPCHSEIGDGNGMIVQRGFPRPPSYHAEPLLHAPVRHFYDVIADGHGAMYDFADRVQPADRWAIAAYIRALQRSQHAAVADVPPDRRGALQ